MKIIHSTIAAAVLGASAMITVPAHATPAAGEHQRHSKAVFVENDAPSGNTVFVYDRTAEGGLAPAGSYATGGHGGVLDGSVVDHLASEGSLTYDESTRLLYAVNAGSNTVTVFGVDGDRLTSRQVISSGGEFPVSIAARGGRVFVLNARDGGSVTGFRLVAGRLRQVPEWTRALGLDPHQTPEFTSTPGQVGFTPDGRHLIVSTKNGADTVDVFSLGPGGPSREPAVTSLPGAVPFGFAFDPSGQLVLTEAGSNTVATFSVGASGGLTQLDSVATGQAATCWVVAVGRRAYVSNAGSGTVSEYRARRDGALTPLGVQSTDAGTVDAAASSDGRYLYVQAGRLGIVDSYAIQPDGTLRPTGAVTVPEAAGAEGIAAS